MGSEYQDIKNDTEAAKRGVMPRINNRIPMRPADIAEQFDDAKPFPSIQTEQKD